MSSLRECPGRSNILTFLSRLYIVGSARRRTCRLAPEKFPLPSTILMISLDGSFKHGSTVGAKRQSKLAAYHGRGLLLILAALHSHRSEERRVGKECRSRWSP